MIIALLFLILFALLFPGTLRFLFVVLLLGAIMVLGGAHAAGGHPIVGLSYWHVLDAQCRGGSGDDESTNQACDKRLAVDKILESQGCKFRYPDGWPGLKGEYWKCSK